MTGAGPMRPPAAERGPLAGMRVLELTHIMAGPVCGLMLADMGADVIKVEKPAGDDTRRMLPPDIAGESAAYMMMNRNKRGIVLDLQGEPGRNALLHLARTADVLIENHRKGTMERLGIGYETLKAENPGLVMASVSGFGRTGPYAERAGFDLIAQGMSGLMSITGEGPGRPPVKVGAPLSDITAGVLLAMGVCAAFAHRQKTGEGQIVETSLFEAAIIQTYWQSAIAFATGISPGPMGSAHPLSAPYQAFETSDGWLNVGAANNANWLRLCTAIDAMHLAQDPRFLDNAARMAHLAELVLALTPIFRTRTTEAWLARLDEAGVPAGPVLSIREMQEDPQTIARAMVPELDHPVAGRMRTIGLPVKFGATPGAVRGPAPTLGQHTAEVLREAGMSDAEVAAVMATVPGVASTRS